MKKIILIFTIVILLSSCWNKTQQVQEQNLSDDEVVQNLEHINSAMDKVINWESEENVMWELGKLKKVKK